MIKKTEFFLSLEIIVGTDDPKQVARSLGVVPTKIHMIGTPLSLKSKRTHVENRLEFRIKSSKDLNLDDMIGKLFGKFRNKRKLKMTLKKYQSQFCAILYATDRSAVLWISPKHLQEISNLGLDFGIDYYLLPSS